MDISLTGASFTLSNSFLSADFSEQGLLQSITSRINGEKRQTKLQLVQYTPKKRLNAHRSNEDGSGAYLFIPDGNATLKTFYKPLVVVVEGHLKSTVNVHQPWLRHRLILQNSPGVDGTGIKVRLELIQCLLITF